jgi:hypothetical protein
MYGHAHHGLLALILLSACALSGCATLSEGECRTADWHQIGRQDGGHGFTRARLHKHREACSEYGVQPQPDRYYDGREIGLQQYCTPRKGYDEGRAGHSYRDVCPAETERAFLAGHRKGEAIHEVESDISDVESEIDRKERRLDHDNTSRRERRVLRRELRDLYYRLRYLNDELVRLERHYTRDL